MSRPHQNSLMSTPDIAEYLGISPSTLRAYVSRGQMSLPEPALRVGRVPVWRRTDVEQHRFRIRSLRGVRVSPDVADWLEAEVARRDATVSVVVEDALRSAMTQKGKE